MSKLFRLAMLISVMAVASLGLSACNTMEGLGKDIKQAGQSLENAADRKK